MNRRLPLIFTFCTFAILITTPAIARSSVDEPTRQRVKQLKDLSERNIKYLDVFIEERRTQLAFEFVSGVTLLKETYERLSLETEPLLKDSLSSDQTGSTEKLRKLKPQWEFTANESGILAYSARNIPPGGDGLVTIYFDAVWEKEKVYGWRFGGFSGLLVYAESSQKIDEMSYASDICKKGTWPSDTSFKTDIDLKNQATSQISTRIRPGQWYMWAFHPQDCLPLSKPDLKTVAVTINYADNPIRLTTPMKEPKWQKSKP
ncbi:MAG TPA: hypothetical protein VJ842_18715 [Pyrinomonadaceae bacterium]|nr:hypothetical protein [Pyrinomonadaceae bacterium]